VLPAPVAAPAEPATATPAPANATLAAPPALKVYFDTGSFNTPADTPLLLDPIIAFLKNNQGAKAVISGFHDKQGNAEANAKLAKNRAKGLREMLKSAGIGDDRIVMEKPQETTGGNSDKEARRVEVSVR
jgi:outer membrane protein OmpA-like peptidoglycan-associated protein